MQTQDAPAEIIFKLWPWLEANKKPLIGGLVGIMVVSGILYFVSAQKAQNEVDAGQALTLLMLDPTANTNSSAQVGGFEQLAAKYSGTAAGKRAQLQAAAALFSAGQYPDAQAQFEKYLDANAGDSLAATAQLGLAASLEAQNKLDLATAGYQKVVSVYASSSAVAQAEFALGRIAEQQNKLTDAMSFYQKIIAGGARDTLTQEAQMRATDLQVKIAAAAPKPAAVMAPATNLLKPAITTLPAATKP